MEISNILRSFLPDARVLECCSYGNGHINLTVKVRTECHGELILQRINSAIFPQPHALMDNITAVTAHLRSKDADPLHSLRFLPARNGSYIATDEAGAPWRAYRFVPGFCLDAPQTPEDLYQSALAFGRFQGQLADFPADTLKEILPDFHNTPHRYHLLKTAVREDRANRLSTCLEELHFLLAQEEIASLPQKKLESGLLPLRVTHNDTKLNNVLLDEHRHALCVLDLDTVMPGLSLFDFGDAIRFGAATAAEDVEDASRMHLDLTLFRAFTEGYLAASDLTDEEKRLLPNGALTMTLETAVRFLTDYLNGDTYFRTNYPLHNLVRARAQIALAADMLKSMDKMTSIVAAAAQKERN